MDPQKGTPSLGNYHEWRCDQVGLTRWFCSTSCSSAIHAPDRILDWVLIPFSIWSELVGLCSAAIVGHKTPNLKQCISIGISINPEPQILNPILNTCGPVPCARSYWQAFEAIDVDESGAISFEEFRKCRAPGARIGDSRNCSL